MEELKNDGDPWSPVDVQAAALEPVEAPEELEVHGGDVTAHLNLGTEPTEEETPAAEEEGATEAEEADTAKEVEDVEAVLAEKLAVLDAAKARVPKKAAKK